MGEGIAPSAPGQQYPAIDSTHVLCAEEVCGERRHGAEAAAIAESDERDRRGEQRSRVQVRQGKENADLNQKKQEIDSGAAEIVGNRSPEDAAQAR